MASRAPVRPNRGGVIALRRQHRPDAGQIVYFPFDPLRARRPRAGALIDNVPYLPLYQRTARNRIDFRTVTLAGAQNFPGVTVRPG